MIPAQWSCQLREVLHASPSNADDAEEAPDTCLTLWTRPGRDTSGMVLQDADKTVIDIESRVIRQVVLDDGRAPHTVVRLMSSQENQLPGFLRPMVRRRAKWHNPD